MKTIAIVGNWWYDIRCNITVVSYSTVGDKTKTVTSIKEYRNGKT